MAAILQLLPDNLPTLSFSVDSLGTYYVPSDTINLNIQARRQTAYSDTSYGGRAVYTKDSLTPFVFQVFVMGNNKNEVLGYAHTLNKTLQSSRGRLEYRPLNASISTFYEYEISTPIEMANATQNKFDQIAVNNNQSALAFEVSIMTHPIGYADWSTLSVQNLTNSTNSFDLTNIKGDQPALLGFNLTSGSTLSRVYCWARSSKLSNLSNVVSFYNFTSPGGWSTQSDATRYGGSYLRSTSTNYLTVSIPNEPDHRHLVAVMPVIRADTTTKVQVSLQGNSGVLWSGQDSFSPETANKWHTLYCGEYRLPLVAYDREENLSLTLRLTFTVTTGNCDVDGLILMFSEESAMMVDIDPTRASGLTTSQTLQVFTNRDFQRIARAVVTSGGAIDKLCTVYGSPALLVQDTTRVYFLGETVSSGELLIPATTMAVTPRVKYRTIVPFGA